ncbi:hypothetical protein [Paraconexibacter sp.]|uniref:hypothetical protein n=1 Tax=Paraconexibacter sp. TaxID=2949640 RepID=UPI003567FCBB
MQPVLAEREVVAEPTASAEIPPQGPGSSDPNLREPSPEATARLCDTCNATMEPEQDWCLECGTAAPGRLGSRAGWRPMAAVVVLTLALVGGAVAASYAALSEDSKIEAGSSVAQADAAPVPQAPPALPPASAAPGAATPVAPGAVAPTDLPKVPTPPSASAAPSVPITPSSPIVPSPPVTPVTPSSGGSSPGTSGGSGGKGDAKEEDDTSSTTKSPVDITLGADAVSIYDPYTRVSVKGDPADAYDGSRDTTFRIGTPDDGKPMGVGIVIDLEKTTAVRGVELVTDTPGYRVEIYGASSSKLPPDILDARWEHFADRSKVDQGKKDGNIPGDDKDRISLNGERKTRWLVLWMTTPPVKSPLVRINELSLFR